MERFSEAWQRYAPGAARLDRPGHERHRAVGPRRTPPPAGWPVPWPPRIDEAGPHPGIDPNAAAEAVVAMVDRFHYLRQFAGEPVDASAPSTRSPPWCTAACSAGAHHLSTTSRPTV